MDVVLTSSISAAESQHVPFDSLHMNTESTPQRRQMRYTSPDLLTPRSPRRMAETSTALVRASPNSDEGYSAMAHTSPTTPPFSAGHVDREAEPTGSDILLEVNSQNHDRMETDMETDDSESDHQPHHGPEILEAPAAAAAQDIDGEIMDMTPDSPTAADLHPQLDAGPALETFDLLLPQNSVDLRDDGHADANVTAALRNNSNPVPDSLVFSSTSLFPPIDSVVSPAVPEGSQPEATDLPAIRSQSEHPPAPADPVVQGWETSASRTNWEGEREEDSQDDESTDEEDYPFWANLKEDTSAPDQEELRAIEESGHETSALDHEYWESYTYEPLDDPEHLPGQTGRIDWTVHGVNGTAEKPNKERVMRSPSVLLGGHYWNIKYYPRGNPNEGTEQLSVYIECSNLPNENGKGEDPPAKDEPQNTNEQHRSRNTQNSTAGPGSSRDELREVPDSMAVESNEAQVPIENGNFVSPRLWSSAEPSSDVTVPWEVAAQISCVIYNPEEPRVNVSQKSSHRYCNENPDWGWTRFHGPWDEIHKRQRFKRQALLRNDTLSFTAYIRVVQDDTGALWWHPPKDKTEWNSVARIGLKRLVHETSHSSALIAALSSWLYLSPVRTLIGNTQIPDLFTQPRNRPKPMIDALQCLVHEAFDPNQATSSFKASLDEIANTISWYGEDSCSSKSDVVATWETLRRILSCEVSDVKKLAEAKDLFMDIWTLKLSDTLLEKDLLSDRAGTQESTRAEPSSTQEAVASAFQTRCQGICHTVYEHRQSDEQYPSVLQVELHRQNYCAKTRRWKKLTHHIRIDETVTIHPSQFRTPMHYTLYGMIVHSGALEANDYYSVIRPAGPGTTWIKYAGGKDPKGVTRLTTKQAREAHEGRGKGTEGTAAVAYVVLYVRTDSLSKILKTSNQSRESITSGSLDMSGSAATMAVDHLEKERRVTFLVYSSDIFKGYTGRGILDPWDPPTSSDHCLRPILEHEFEASKTLADVEQYLTDIRKEAGESKRFRLWMLDTKPRSSVRGSPRFALALGAGKRLDELVAAYGGCRFWLQAVSADDLEDMMQSENPPVGPPPTSSSEPMEAIEGLSTSNANHPDETLQEQAPPNSDGEAPEQSGDHVSSGSSTQTPNVGGSQTAANSLTPGHAGLLDISAASHAHETPISEDVPMDESREGEPRVSAAPRARGVPSLSWVSSTEQPPRAHIERIYILIKAFDCTSQTLCGIGGLFAKREEKIGEVIRLFLALDPKDKFDVYNERSLLLYEKDRVNLNGSFEGIDNNLFLDGSVFIVQHRSPATEIARLETEGKCTNPIDFFAWLRYQDVPAYLQDHRVQCYFGSSYLSSSQKYGRPHGFGVLVTMAGDAYSGNFVAGSICGLGTMAYANGDTYTGQWHSDEPNGQGKMVYAKTGNVYIGGFKKRKRHGKGTMQFEVADEEMAMCNICYEEEMDALFYDCGHVTACEQCAKRVDICPVCRKSVRAVVKIWRT